MPIVINTHDPDAARNREVCQHLAFKGHGQQSLNVQARARQLFAEARTEASESALPSDKALDDAIRREIEWHAARIP